MVYTCNVHVQCVFQVVAASMVAGTAIRHMSGALPNGFPIMCGGAWVSRTSQTIKLCAVCFVPGSWLGRHVMHTHNDSAHTVNTSRAKLRNFAETV